MATFRRYLAERAISAGWTERDGLQSLVGASVGLVTRQLGEGTQQSLDPMLYPVPCLALLVEHRVAFHYVPILHGKNRSIKCNLAFVTIKRIGQAGNKNRPFAPQK